MAKIVKKDSHVQAMMTDENRCNMNKYQAQYLLKGERIGKSTIVNRALKIFFAQAFDRDDSHAK
jgi:hypothetical protein